MKYRRKSDGLILEITLLDFFFGVCPIPYHKLIRDWEEIKELSGEK